MDSLKILQQFDEHFREWVNSACSEWDCSRPQASYYAKFNERLPDGLRTLLGIGLADGIIIQKEHRFCLKGLDSGKGPYQWFSKPSDSDEPAPNWEYFVQVSEYVRLYPVAAKTGLSLKFEDDTMDITLYRNGKLFIYWEAKEKITQIQNLIRDIPQYQLQIDWSAPNRGNDPLKKSKVHSET